MSCALGLEFPRTFSVKRSTSSTTGCVDVPEYTMLASSALALLRSAPSPCSKSSPDVSTSEQSQFALGGAVDGDAEALGLRLELGDVEAVGLTEAEADNEADTLGEIDDDGLILDDGLSDVEADGLSELVGDTEALELPEGLSDDDGLVDADGDVEDDDDNVTDAEAEADRLTEREALALGVSDTLALLDGLTDAEADMDALVSAPGFVTSLSNRPSKVSVTRVSGTEPLAASPTTLKTNVLILPIVMCSWVIVPATSAPRRLGRRRRSPRTSAQTGRSRRGCVARESETQNARLSGRESGSRRPRRE